MCLLVVLWRVTRDVPLVIAANREEYYARGGDPPRPLDGVHAVGGVDPLQGGTWLGVNAHGVLVAVTNRRKSDLPESPRSRGLLARDLLAAPSAREAADRAAHELATDRYPGCNFLCADARDCIALQAGDWLRVVPLPPGIHILSNRDVNDPIDPRVRLAHHWLDSRPLDSWCDAWPALRELCSSEAICFREPERGTVSSSFLVLPPDLAGGIYLHAQGAPDRSSYADFSHLLRDLAPSRKG